MISYMPTEIKKEKYWLLENILILGLPLVEVWESFTPSFWHVTSENLILFLLYQYNVTSSIRDFEVFDFQILKMEALIILLCRPILNLSSSILWKSDFTGHILYCFTLNQFFIFKGFSKKRK
jgi:hypothetical protein